MTRTQFKAKTAARLALGAIFTVFGLNGFLHFIPAPPPSGLAAVFVGGLGASGYFFPLLKGTAVAVGLLLLSNRFVPLALTVLAPIVRFTVLAGADARNAPLETTVFEHERECAQVFQQCFHEGLRLFLVAVLLDVMFSH